MQRPIDLLALRNAMEACPHDQRRSFFPLYERVLSHRHALLQYKREELGSLERFVDEGLAHGVTPADFAGFAYSYAIPHISKEFDLLKVGESLVLDIELKSRRMPEEDILRQLLRNYYYLSFLDREVVAFSYCSDDDSWFGLGGNQLYACSWETVATYVRQVGTCDADLELDTLFVPANYLVSPVMDVERFLEGRYFLTNQQEQIKRMVIRQLNERGQLGFAVQGDAGTGKSLLLYDTARTVTRLTQLPAAIVHGAPLSEYHQEFNRAACGVEVLGPDALEDLDVRTYCFVGFDEAHRMDLARLGKALNRANEAHVPFVAMVDSRQALAQPQSDNPVAELVMRCVSPEHRFVLTKRLRTNPDTAWFIDAFVLGRRGGYPTAKGVEVSFAPSETAARELVGRYVRHGYQYISISSAPHDMGGARGDQAFPTTFDVIGLEYDSVVMVVPASVRLEGRHLCDMEGCESDLSATKLLYQGLTRARDRIALVFCHDWEVFRYAVDLLDKANE